MPEQINIIFPPGLGGNHLANLISLDKKYSLSVDFSVYDSDGPHVHQDVERINNNVKISLYHIGEFIHRCKLKNLRTNSKNILISMPKMDSSDLSYQRMSSWAPEYKNTFIYSNHAQIYSKFLIDKLLETPCVEINGSLIFQEDILPVLLILEKLDINTDHTEAADYHVKWLDKIKKHIK